MLPFAVPCIPELNLYANVPGASTKNNGPFTSPVRRSGKDAAAGPPPVSKTPPAHTQRPLEIEGRINGYRHRRHPAGAVGSLSKAPQCPPGMHRCTIAPPYQRNSPLRQKAVDSESRAERNGSSGGTCLKTQTVLYRQSYNDLLFFG
ncbi:hypothetical protein D0C36_20450 [Mucilaginibacter conchicola]|uniref:Uncharacterized protein n=1 Tax=Mucilaginibacter conchicola TaxID=2303333 RepID=A0A372NQV5_9SPHI|nr:hypothetical protein D0C36_20450 [Mucilaginibacter conchicola]